MLRFVVWSNFFEPYGKQQWKEWQNEKVPKKGWTKYNFKDNSITICQLHEVLDFFFKIKIYKLITTSRFNEIIILDVGVKQLQQFEKKN